MLTYNQYPPSATRPWLSQPTPPAPYINSSNPPPLLSQSGQFKTLTRENKAFLRSLGFKVR